MASHRELSKLTTNMNTVPSSGRPSRNSQGICNMFHHPLGYLALQSDQQSTLVNTPLSRSVLTNNGPDQESISARTLPSQRQVENFTLHFSQNNRFVDPIGRPLQPGTVIISNNGIFTISQEVALSSYMLLNLMSIIFYSSLS